jgi:hypothetical protein
LLTVAVLAQKKTDSSVVRIHSPRKAALYAAVLPGLGQIYNRKYWKLPVVYGAGATAGYLIYYNYTIFNKLNAAYMFRKDNDPETSLETFTLQRINGKQIIDLTLFGDDEILTLKNTYRRDLDLSVLFAAAVYGLNILDAVVDAHLYSFDVSDDLSLQLKPTTLYTAHQIQPGISLKLSLR